MATFTSWFFHYSKGKNFFSRLILFGFGHRENLGTHRAHNAACWWKGPFQVSQPRLWNGFHLRLAWSFSNVSKTTWFSLDQRLRDAKISPEKKEKVMKTIWERFTSDDEFYRINESDYKSQFRSRGFRFCAPIFWTLCPYPLKKPHRSELNNEIEWNVHVKIVRFNANGREISVFSCTSPQWGQVFVVQRKKNDVACNI